MVSARKILLIGLGVGLLLGLVLWVGFEMGFLTPDEPTPVESAGPSRPMTAGLESDELQETMQVEREAIETRSAEPLPSLSTHREPLTGIVITLAGEPVPGAEVILEHRAAQSFGIMDLDYLEERQVIDRTATAEDGTFSFLLPSLRAFVLRARAAGFAQTRRNLC